MVSPNSSSINCSCASGSPLPAHLARPFRIMCTASIPCSVRHADENDWYTLANQTRFFETRWSCSTTLFKYLHRRSRHRCRIVPSTLPPSDTLGSCPRDHLRLRIGWIEQRFTKESLRRRSIALCREQEINGVPSGIHGPVQISVLPFDPESGRPASNNGDSRIGSPSLVSTFARSRSRARPMALDRKCVTLIHHGEP